MAKKPARTFSREEQAAMKERARELKAQAKAATDRAAGERTVLAAIAKLPAPDRALGERLHALVAANAPSLWPRLWYGMPAYANPPATGGKVVCFFQAAAKFKTRYATLGFTDSARLDAGAKNERPGLWATGFGLAPGSPSADVEARLAALLRRAVE